VDLGQAVTFVLAAVLAVVPALVDRWAVRHGASPEALIALATITLAGIAAVPVAFAIYAGAIATHDSGHVARGAVAIAGLLLVAIAAGRALARTIAIRRRWRALERVAAALDLQTDAGGVNVLPVGELLAFAAGTTAFVSTGLLERLKPPERSAVVEHEREHARSGHGRLLAVARAITHASFGLAPATRAARALERELDVLADRAAAQRLDDAAAVASALQSLATHTADNRAALEDPITRRRLEQLCAPCRRGRVDNAVRLIALIVGAGVLTAVCLSARTSTLWLGLAACALLIASVIAFTAPLRTRDHGSSAGAVDYPLADAVESAEGVSTPDRHRRAEGPIPLP
jgi:hypothetical protein